MKQLYYLRVLPQKFKSGNKVAVYIFADHLTDDMLKSISNSQSVRHTVFVFTGHKAEFRLRFFNKSQEVDLCSHSIIASFNLLRDINIINKGSHTFENKDDVFNIDVGDDHVFIEHKDFKSDKEISENELKQCFNHLRLNTKLKPRIIVSLNRELMIALDSQETLNKLTVNSNALNNLSNKYRFNGVVAFITLNEFDAYSRYFYTNNQSTFMMRNSCASLAYYLFSYYKMKTKYTLSHKDIGYEPFEIIANIFTFDRLPRSIWVGGKAYICE